MRYVRILVCAIVFLVLSAPVPLRAEGDVLRVALNELPPWKIFDARGNVYGIDVDFLELLASQMELKIEYARYPFIRCLYLLEQGEVDLMTGVLRRDERENYLHFIEPPYKNYTHKVFYTTKGRAHLLQEYDDLHYLKVGTRIGGSYFPKFDQDQKINKEVVKSFELNLKMLQLGRVDVAIHSEMAGDYVIRKLGLEDVIAKAPYAYRKRQDVYMVLSKKSPLAHRLDEFNSVMADMVRDGEFERIKARFFEYDHTP